MEKIVPAYCAIAACLLRPKSSPPPTVPKILPAAYCAIAACSWSCASATDFSNVRKRSFKTWDRACEFSVWVERERSCSSCSAEVLEVARFWMDVWICCRSAGAGGLGRSNFGWTSGSLAGARARGVWGRLSEGTVQGRGHGK